MSSKNLGLFVIEVKNKVKQVALRSSNIRHFIYEAPWRFQGTLGNMAIKFIGTWQQKENTTGNKGTKHILGNGEH